jgi:hypothetical protein
MAKVIDLSEALKRDGVEGCGMRPPNDAEVEVRDLVAAAIFGGLLQVTIACKKRGDVAPESLAAMVSSVMAEALVDTAHLVDQPIDKAASTLLTNVVFVVQELVPGAKVLPACLEALQTANNPALRGSNGATPS